MGLKWEWVGRFGKRVTVRVVGDDGGFEGKYGVM
jgi:hypothetical protein